MCQNLRVLARICLRDGAQHPLVSPCCPGSSGRTDDHAHTTSLRIIDVFAHVALVVLRQGNVPSTYDLQASASALLYPGTPAHSGRVAAFGFAQCAPYAQLKPIGGGAKSCVPIALYAGAVGRDDFFAAPASSSRS